MSIVKGEGQDERLTTAEIHNILRNERRRRTIEYLKNQDGEATVRDIAEYIAKQETETSPPPRDARNSAYISLHQTHLPTLDSHGIVEYDTPRKAVSLEQTVRELDPYLQPGRQDPRFSLELFYLGYSIVGSLVIMSALAGVPLVSLVEPAAWAAGYAVITLLLLGFELARRRELFDRLSP